MPSQIQILNTHLTGKEKSLITLFSRKKLANLKIAEVYNISKNLNDGKFAKATKLLCNPISQLQIHAKNIKTILKKYGKFKWVIEVSYLPGVTDNVGHTAEEMIKENIKNVSTSFSVGSSLLFFLDTKDKKIIEAVAAEESNPLIHQISFFRFSEYIKILQKVPRRSRCMLLCCMCWGESRVNPPVRKPL